MGRGSAMKCLLPFLGAVFLLTACGSRRVPTSPATVRVANPSSEAALLQKLLLHQQAAARIRGQAGSPRAHSAWSDAQI